MASIEILENTLLKLLVRRGTDLDRQQIVLSEGELGYCVDTKRLYLGDGTTPGGILAGNKFLGSVTDITTIAGASIGDFVFDSDGFSFYRLATGTGSILSDWELIGTVNTASNGTIVVNSDNSLEVGKLSAGNFDNDALGNSITLDGSLRVSLSSNIKTDKITSYTPGDYLSLPEQVAVNSVNYKFPSTSPIAGQYLKGTGLDNKLVWDTPGVIYSAVAPTTAALIPVGTIVPFVSASSTVPYGWLVCDGSSVDGSTYPELSALIGTTYGGTATNFNVPDLRNKSLYGSTDPFNSTLYDLESASGTNSLSAIGTNFIIKAIGGVTNPTLTIESPLSATLNDIDITDTTINPLSGEIKIGYKPTTVLFNQQGEIQSGNNVTSVSLSAPSYLSNVTNFTYYAQTNTNSYLNYLGYTGVYEIKLNSPVSNVNTAIVDIQTLNYRSLPSNGNIPDDRAFYYDYGWVDTSTLVIGIVNIAWTGYSSKNTLDSGQINSKTRFKVSVLDI